jgi:hypothetical protein
MGEFVGERHIHLAGHRVGFGNLFGFQTFSLQHVHEIGVATEVELVSSVETNTPFLEKVGQNPVSNGCAHLGFDVVAYDR